MRLEKAYLIKVLGDALEQIQELADQTASPVGDHPEPLPQPPGAPAVAPPNAPLFPIDVMENIERYKEKALMIQDFEGFMALLTAVATELNLNPAVDLPNLAAIFNKWRLAEGLDPL